MNPSDLNCSPLDLGLLSYQADFAANTARFKIGLWDRQTGKDHTATAEAVLDCFHNPGATWISTPNGLTNKFAQLWNSIGLKKNNAESAESAEHTENESLTTSSLPPTAPTAPTASSAPSALILVNPSPSHSSTAPHHACASSVGRKFRSLGSRHHSRYTSPARTGAIIY